LQLLDHRELLILKNLSCSPMSFATKILFKIFKIDELHGHNVSGKTLNKNIKTKLPLDPIRIGYIKYLVESYYDEKECRAMLSGAITHKQDLWKSCHTAINKSILISERKAALNQTNNNTATTMTSLNDSIAGLNATNLTTSENDETTKKKTPRKSKLDHENSTESNDEEDGLEGTSKERKLITKNSANTTSVLARNRASHNKSLNDNSDVLLKPAQKRLRRFKSDESSSSCSSFDFGGGFLSEEFNSCEDENNENSDDDDDDDNELDKATVMRKKAKNKLTANQKKVQPKTGLKKRVYTKTRPANNKIFNEDTLNYETDSDDSDDDEEEDCQNEIELIQNIEKRLLNSNTTSLVTTAEVAAAAAAAIVVTTTPTVTSKTRATPKLLLHATQKPKENKISSSEASAAANIAAAMKKRIVVIGPDNVNTESDIEHATTSITTTNNQTTATHTTTTLPKSSSSLTINKKVNSTSSNNKAE
jgi:hypothetical protein